MRIPATQEATDGLGRAIQAWRPGDAWAYRPKVEAGEPCHIALPDHAAAICAALRLKSFDLDAARREAAKLDDSAAGFFLYLDRESLERALQTLWAIASVDDAWTMIQKKVVEPVLKKFVTRQRGESLDDAVDRADLVGTASCLELLAYEIVPETTPPHPEAWDPEPRKRLLGNWRTVLRRRIIDEGRSQRGWSRADEPLSPGSIASFVSLEPSEVDSIVTIATENPQLDLLELYERIAAVVGDDWKYLAPDASPESLDLPRRTFYDRRKAMRERVETEWPELAAHIPDRRSI